MKLLEEIIEYNQQFIEEKKYEEFTTTKFPQKKLSFCHVWIQDLSSCFHVQ